MTTLKYKLMGLTYSYKMVNPNQRYVRVFYQKKGKEFFILLEDGKSCIITIKGKF